MMTILPRPHLRWRGQLNMKDITERAIASFIGGITTAVTFYLLIQVLG